ncbi:uncharacterized protein Z519_03474 [Cladophialophora bantiana CBS 173.52]|uniref:Nucleoside phosphorylase domain-containing protein n=1 Tax=Cladophialophora bantiana (strain ATCC 10958 / CBS 173.52 / CDC B-1940 / NIH 8579) TaxID=1442370 RepID=A0A0D2HZR0_CLAB1|nr:uncharacterized protein Z519_03474 [Cladophialophora bantiana CBS 173.52]KIW96405.1 hypothetical protein Z519_03474 [Cladophialophora bantiana CBS 173.52]
MRPMPSAQREYVDLEILRSNLWGSGFSVAAPDQGQGLTSKSGAVSEPGRDDFEIAIICALTIEHNAVEILLEEEYDTNGFSYGKAPGNSNAYTTGRLGGQHVVPAYMPGMGVASSAAVAAHLRTSFERIKFAIIVGICSGDIIVGMSVIQIDIDQQYSDKFIGRKELEDTLRPANLEIRAYVRKTLGYLAQKRIGDKIGIFHTQICATDAFTSSVYPRPENKNLYPADYWHKHRIESCDAYRHCDAQGDEVCKEALQIPCIALAYNSNSIKSRARVQQA